MNDPYVDSLRKLYDCRKIGVCKEKITFACSHLESCKAAAEPRSLCKGAEAHVGEKYGDPIRIVFISLDTGGSEEEFGEALLKRRKTIQSVTYDCANPHMRGTIETLRHLYGWDISESCLLKRFAMTNSAKCSGKDKSKKRLPDKLYENCREHGLAELGVLDPELIVTQGGPARDLLKCQDIDGQKIQKHVPSVIWNDLYMRSWICKQLKGHLKYWKNGERDVLVFQTTHPSAPGQWPLFKKTILPIAAYVIRQWFSGSDDFFRSCKK